jgi:hypothetical protein
MSDVPQKPASGVDPYKFDGKRSWILSRYLKGSLEDLAYKIHVMKRSVTTSISTNTCFTLSGEVLAFNSLINSTPFRASSRD